MASKIPSEPFHFRGLQKVYHGKVRDVYFTNDKVVMIASDRISAFDHILPKEIPYKGQVLNMTAAHFLNATKDIVPNWLLSTPHQQVSIGLKCEPFKIEMVVRGYLAGHAWRTYKSGKREVSGVPLVEGLKESDKLPEPIITPATKAEEGHDEDISREEIIRTDLATEEQYNLLEKYTLALFERGTEMADKQGLILVDTKYEFGIYEDTIYLIDEIHTPDSSRYFIKEGYEERQSHGIKQAQLSKEFVREWLMAHDFQGKEGQIMPYMPDDFVKGVSEKYISLYEQITGQTFVRSDVPITSAKIEEWLDALQNEDKDMDKPVKKKFNIPVVTAALYELEPSRYELRSGLEEDAPYCPHGHPFKWIGYDKNESDYIRFTKSVFKRLVNDLDPEFVAENEKKHAKAVDEECCD